MKDIKKILLKLLLLLGLIVVLNFIYKKTLYDTYKDKNTEFVKLIDQVPSDFDILYIGESSNITTRKNDYDKRSISEMIASCYPDLSVHDITKPAAHSGVFYHFLRALPKNNKEQTIIVTLNLRSFNTVWINSELETSLQKNSLLIYPYPPFINRALLSFKHYDQSTYDERLERVVSDWKNNPLPVSENFPHQNTKVWDKHMAVTGIKNEKGKKDPDKTILACHYIKTYAFGIDTLTNPRIQDFNHIIKLAKKRNWNLVFNLMAENTDKAQLLVGDELVNIMHYNATLLTQYFTRKNVTVINNLNSIRDNQFIDQNWTTEHYAEKGRKTIALSVSESIKEYHPKYFEKNLNLNQKNLFSNFDKDHSGLHGYLNKTKDFSFSGDYSIKIDKKHIYSQAAVFEKSEDSTAQYDEIFVSAMLLNPEKKSDALLIIEGKQANEFVFWKSVNLNKHITNEKDWQRFQYNLKIDRKMNEAEIIKVYFMHKNGNAVYIDDFKTQLN
jgi:hypothetical protein